MNLSTLRELGYFPYLGPALAARLLPFFALRVGDVALVAVNSLLAFLVAQVDLGPMSVFASLLGLNAYPLFLDFLLLSFLLGVFGRLAQV